MWTLDDVGVCAAGSKRAADGATEVGQPLPDLGTCRHYAHSHRSALARRPAPAFPATLI